MPTILFAPNWYALKLGKSLGVPVVCSGYGGQTNRQRLEEFSAGRIPTLVVSEGYVTGWAAPAGTEVYFMEGFPTDRSIRAQARARAERYYAG